MSDERPAEKPDVRDESSAQIWDKIPDGPEHTVEVKANPALSALYIWGAIFAGVGFVTAGIGTGIASAEISSYSPDLSVFAAASGFQSIGLVGGALGIAAVLLGAVAHAVNWQISKTLGDRSR